MSWSGHDLKIWFYRCLLSSCYINWSVGISSFCFSDHPGSWRIHDYISLWIPCRLQPWLQLCWVYQLCYFAMDRLWKNGNPSRCQESGTLTLKNKEESAVVLMMCSFSCAMLLVYACWYLLSFWGQSNDFLKCWMLHTPCKEVVLRLVGLD